MLARFFWGMPYGIMAIIQSSPAFAPLPPELGQVVTPRRVADWMVRWACADRPQQILDPAMGPGVFVEAVQSLFETDLSSPPPCMDAYEIDSKMLRGYTSKAVDLCVRIHRQDFITSAVSHVYDAIVANPPYVRHHDMTYDDSVFREFDEVVGARLSRMTNLYGLFLIKMWTLLAPNGRAAIITPAEWLNADFGRVIKAYLLRHNAIEGIIHFDHASQIFKGALTTAAIILLRRGRAIEEPIVLSSVANIEDLENLRLSDGYRVDSRQLDPARKWTPHFRSGVDLTIDSSPTLGDIARCQRGIATGANEYFALRESERSQYGIDIRDVRPCVTKARQVKSDRITQADVQQWIGEDQRVYLLDPRPRVGRALARYLEVGRRLGIDQRHLPSHRPVWYRPERRKPAPILVSVFARGEFKFALNEAGVLNLTAYHGIYPRTTWPACVRAIFEYLRSDEGRMAMSRHLRIYARGLLKVEPRDVEALPIPIHLYEFCNKNAPKPSRMPA